MEIRIFTNSVDESTAKEIQAVFLKAFGVETGKDFFSRVNEKRSLLVILAYIGNELVGFKLGYEKHRGTFFSWLGAVSPSYQKKGIACELLRNQHLACFEAGYKEVQTEVKGGNTNMLLLNIKEGFSIFGTHLGHNNEITVQLRKLL
jgi:predicted GNAT superfamily acetyltransferase